ncbi:hypothetical protein N7499_005187 [Penicillium canescens]|uniref:Rhodopsin domain-containing protein n=1 Tax=Penicillium canescens TaxID=5083 RepID=A0AAD6I1K1_PENCN|nr:hypothetical protein N7522_004421 [Penicillium canescens]KAJ6027083.1 hypothetical protein N7460_011900 [Penicillium canescens]KAJ6040366.1 hypothetical protein N7444_009271 [Penicillium canescens]KAJ6085558.1 hypothetical protein N7499_005187 [Penicillium canescens]KAJ6162333.1 hypothetical protein N7485_010563 [Penicillium canescens]
MLVLASTGVFVKLLMLGHPRNLGIDGVLCVISWIFAFVLCFTSMWSIVSRLTRHPLASSDTLAVTRYGYGKHIEAVEADIPAMSMFLKLIVVTAISYLIAMTAIQVSFCLLYKRLFAVTHVGWAYWLLITIVVLQFIEELLVFIFQCSPIRKLVDATGLVQGRCLDLYVFYIIHFATRLATNIAIFTLPIPKLLKLQMKRGAKVGVVLFFGLGLLVCATSIIRATYLKRFQVDYTWDLVNALNWSAVEVCTAVFIACIPSFKALITVFFPLLRKYMGFSSGSTPHQHINEENSGDSPTDYFNLPATQRVQSTPDCFPLPSPVVEYHEPPNLIMSGAIPTVPEGRALRQDPRLDYSIGGKAQNIS